MKILLISPCSPYPVLSGAELRVYHLFRALCARHDVHLICQEREKVNAAAVAHLQTLFREVQIFPGYRKPEPPRLRNIGAWLRKVRQTPAEYFDYDGYNRDIEKAVRKVIEIDHYDVVYQFGWGMRRYLAGLPTVPTIVDLVDNPVIFIKRRIGEQHSLLGKVRAFREWLLMRKLVKDEFSRFQDIVMVSSADAVALRRILPKTAITVVPNGVDSAFYTPGPQPQSDDPVLIFTGVMNYGPNYNAMLFFCKSVYPLIRDEVPNVSLLIVGRYPPPDILELASSGMNIMVTGAVDDMRPYFDRAAVYVCPLQSGSGIKNKILEAWSMQKPVVATSISCEGIDIEPGQDILVADDRHDFARQVVTLLGDRELRSRLGSNGRAKVERAYSWDSRARMIEDMFTRRLQLMKERGLLHSGHEKGAVH